MIDHVWTVVCSRAVTDIFSNNVSIQNVIEQINLTEEPQPDTVVNIEIEVVTLWVRQDADTPIRGRARITFVSPSRETYEIAQTEIDLSEHERLRSRRRVQGLPIRELGRHAFTVDLRLEGKDEWQQVASVPLSVILTSPKESKDAATN